MRTKQTGWFLRGWLLVALTLAGCARPTSTPGATPDYQATVENMIPWPIEQTTDGILLLSIEEIVNKCYKPGETIRIKLIFRNLTSEPLTLQNRFFVTPDWSVIGDLYVNYYSDNNTDIYSPILSYIEFSLPPETFIEITGNGQITTIINDQFPDTILLNNEIDNEATPSPGRYLVRVTYKNFSSGAENAWTGSVTSNALEVCIK